MRAEINEEEDPYERAIIYDDISVHNQWAMLQILFDVSLEAVKEQTARELIKLVFSKFKDRGSYYHLTQGKHFVTMTRAEVRHFFENDYFEGLDEGLDAIEEFEFFKISYKIEDDVFNFSIDHEDEPRRTKSLPDNEESYTTLFKLIGYRSLLARHPELKDYFELYVK